MKKKIKLIHHLPFVQLRIWHKGQSLLLHKVLIDTGSASTIIKLDLVEKIGITAEERDYVGTISGVGGSEYIFLKTLDSIEFNGLHIENFTVDVGVMDYGIEINGIIGMDFLLRIRGIINLDELFFMSNFREE
jgi:predicted aspartyl protease